MKYILAALCFLCAALAAAQTVYVSQMVVPKVEHKQRTETQTYDEVTRSCPDGYEGHFVDTRTGFGWEYWNGGWGFIVGPEPGYTICFKKEFMDEIRKNPELLVARPAQPKAA